MYIPKKHADEYLLRFLKARNMDVEKASQMFMTSMVRPEWIRFLRSFPHGLWRPGDRLWA